MKLSEKDGKKRGIFKVTLFAIFALRICHYLIGDICNWMCVGSVTYSLVILLNRSTLTSIAYLFFSSNHGVFFGATYTKGSHSGTALFFLFVPVQNMGVGFVVPHRGERSILNPERGTECKLRE